MNATPRRARIVCAAILAAMLIVPSLAWPTRVSADSDLSIGGQAVIAYANGDPVRLRSGPGYDRGIITSFPEGTTLEVLDGPFTATDGTFWYEVSRQGTTGYMVSDYLARGGTSSAANGTAATTISDLNLRADASTSSGVLLVMPPGASVTIDGASRNGFSPITYQGTSGWAANDYLSTGGSSSGSAITGYATVFDGALNLRSGPGTGYGVLLVLPDAAEVGLTGESSNGYLSVVYSGVEGWAYAGFLDTGDGVTGEASIPSVIDTLYTTSDLNLRSGAGLSNAVLLVMPSGAEVGVLGAAQNNFYPIRYNGTDGWASADFLGGAPDPEEPAPPSVVETLYTTTSLNLRSGASTSNTIVLVMPGGAEVGVLGAAQNNFYPVRYDGTDGWASADFLGSAPPAETPAQNPGGNSGGSGIVWPVSGGAWEITQGYNGSSHYNGSSTYQYYYSFDIARADRQTAGQPVYSPVSGTVRWTERGSGGMSIDMGNGYAVAFFHVTIDPSWEWGERIEQGDYVGFVSGPGGDGYAQFPHIHFSVWATTDGGNWSRVAEPFVGQNAISGVEYPFRGNYSDWSGTVFYP